MGMTHSYRYFKKRSDQPYKMTELGKAQEQLLKGEALLGQPGGLADAKAAFKAGIVAATITLGKVGDGWLAWVTITAITLTAIGLQLAFVPFPVDTAKAEQVLCECAPEACSPDGPLKLLSVFLMSVKNPSLNDLQLAGLICQLATLACGLLCVTINRPDVNFVIGCCSLAAMGCFVALVLHFWHVSLAAVLADRYQEKTRYHEKVSREPTASAKKTPI